jgi:hypothetical protein
MASHAPVTAAVPNYAQRSSCLRRPTGLWKQAPKTLIGAGEGNRTLVCSLGSCRSTIELRPPKPDPASMTARNLAATKHASLWPAENLSVSMLAFQ